MLRSRKQVGAHLLENRLKEDPSAKRLIVCQNSNCDVPEGSDKKMNHAVNIEANMVLCPPCNNYFTKNGQHRPTEAVQLYLKQSQVAEHRKAGGRIECGYCSKVEQGGQKHGINSQDLKV